MNPIEYVRAVKRRWVDVVLAVIVALVAGFFISEVAPPAPKLQSYEATSVLLASGNFFAPGAPSLEAIAELAVVGDVPRRVAENIDYQGNPADLAQTVQTSVNTEAGILRVKVTAPSPEDAQRYSTAFAKAVVGYLRDLQASSVSEQALDYKVRLDALQEDIANKEVKIDIASTPGDIAVATQQRDALIRQYGLLYETYRQIAGGAVDPANLTIIQAGTPQEISTGGIEPPRSRIGILVLAAFLGVLAGVILVLVLDRFDNRIRTRQAAEKAFGVPVLAEIPYVSRFRRRHDRIRSLDEPRSATADAFRIVAAILSMPRPIASPNGKNGGSAPAEHAANGETAPPPRRILVTSPGPSDGKTTVSANIAAVLGARGAQTTVFSCDLRRPHIHRLFDVPPAPGLAEAFSAGGVGVLEVPFIESPVAPNVRVVPSGVPPEQPGEILGSEEMRLTIQAAALNSDTIVIDTAPVLSTSDAAPLLGQVDAVLVVARAGRTTAEVAQRTAEVLRRLNAPVIGVILNAAAEMNVPRRYYSYRYYRRAEEKTQKRKGFPRLSRHKVEV